MTETNPLRAVHNVDYTIVFTRDLAAMRRFFAAADDPECNSEPTYQRLAQRDFHVMTAVQWCPPRDLQ